MVIRTKIVVIGRKTSKDYRLKRVSTLRWIMKLDEIITIYKQDIIYPFYENFDIGVDKTYLTIDSAQDHCKSTGNDLFLLYDNSGYYEFPTIRKIFNIIGINPAKIRNVNTGLNFNIKNNNLFLFKSTLYFENLIFDCSSNNNDFISLLSFDNFRIDNIKIKIIFNNCSFLRPNTDNYSIIGNIKKYIHILFDHCYLEIGHSFGINIGSGLIDFYRCQTTKDWDASFTNIGLLDIKSHYNTDYGPNYGVLKTIDISNLIPSPEIPNPEENPCEDADELVITGPLLIAIPGNYQYFKSGGIYPYVWSVEGTGCSILQNGNLTVDDTGDGQFVVSISDYCETISTLSGEIIFSENPMLTTLDPNFCRESNELSDNNTTVTIIGLPPDNLSMWGLVRSTTHHSTGKKYLEVTVHDVAHYAFGIVNSNANYYGWPGGNSYGFSVYIAMDGQQNGVVMGKYAYGSFSLYGPIGYDIDSVIGICIDFDLLTIGFYVDGNDLGVAYNIPQNLYYAAFSGYEYQTSFTVNFGNSSFQYTIPEGFDAWDVNVNT